MHPPVVLVVDDDEAIRNTARSILEDEGYAVELASNGAEALTHLQTSSPPELLLLDLMMPVMNGLALLRELEAHTELATIPVVIMTAASVSLETSSLRYPILRKPFKLDTLLEFVTSYAPWPWDDDEVTEQSVGDKSVTPLTDISRRLTE